MDASQSTSQCQSLQRHPFWIGQSMHFSFRPETEVAREEHGFHEPLALCKEARFLGIAPIQEWIEPWVLQR